MFDIFPSVELTDEDWDIDIIDLPMYFFILNILYGIDKKLHPIKYQNDNCETDVTLTAGSYKIEDIGKSIVSKRSSNDKFSIKQTIIQ